MTTIVFRYFPLFSFLFTFIPSLIKRNWYNSLPDVDNETKNQYKLAFWGYVILWTVIWAPMIFGIFFGNVPTMIHFFVRGSGNIYINVYWIILAAIYVVGFIWIFFFQGAEFISNYDFPMIDAFRSRENRFSPTPIVIKVVFVIGLVGFVLIWFFGLPDGFGVVNDLLATAP